MKAITHSENETETLNSFLTATTFYACISEVWNS